jgi:general secretion pathway protein K
LSSFLAADRNNNTDEVLQAFLSGEVLDLQSRLNFMNVVKLSGTGAAAKAEISPPDLEALKRLYTQLNLPLPELTAAVDELLSTTELAANDPLPSPTALKPRKLAHLGWLGIGPASLAALEPHVTVLPERTTLNINTASAQALVASMAQLDMALAQRLVAERERNPFKTLTDASRLLPALQGQLLEAQHGTRSRFFEVRGRLRLDDAVVEERSLVVRNGLNVRVSWRERIAGR